MDNNNSAIQKIIFGIYRISNENSSEESDIHNDEIYINELVNKYNYVFKNRKIAELNSRIINQKTHSENYSARRQILKLKAEELLYYFMDLLKQTSIQNIQIDYTWPLIALLIYRIGYLNKYDIALINYCQELKMDPISIIAIYLLERKKNIHDIIKLYAPYDNTPLFKIMQLKKLSAELKFRINYGIKDDVEIAMLYDKRSIWQNII